ncbi:MAG: hypothetical protein H0X41_07020 [Chitinophagaceae bacterium]|nr:hypothetical protein [Chitinophagaceae bacterium]
MKYPFLLITAAFFLFACGEKKPVTASPVIVTKKDSTATPKSYFPVVSFIKGEIAYVDSLPVGIKKYTGDNKKKYVYINPDEFHRLAAEFIPHEISDSFFLKHYRETSFLDRSSNSATFYYVPENETLPVRRVDVLTMKGDVYDQVKSIYLQKNYRSGDTAFIKKLYWRPHNSFQIITEATKDSGQPRTEIINVVWDNREEE